VNIVASAYQKRQEKLIEKPATTKAADVHAQIKQDIIRGRWMPGEKLSIIDLRNEYEVSLSPLREALSRLAAVGYVVSEGQRGFSVAPVSRDDLIDANRIRVQLECWAIREAMARGDKNWEADIIAAFHRLALTPYEDEDRPGTVSAEWTLCHQGFHNALVSAAGSRWLEQFRDIVYDEMERYRNLSLSNYISAKRAMTKGKSRKKAGNIDPFENDHKLILDAVLSRDADKTCALIEEHFNKTVHILEGMLQD
jgi:GntR family transcriptional regulator, carbon starvation induced regulator